MMTKFLSAMYIDQSDLFYSSLQELLVEIISYFDANKRTQEQFYNGFVLGLIAYLQSSYTIKADSEIDYDRFDIVCIPNHDKNPGVILEFKVSKAKNRLQCDADSTLEQIETKSIQLSHINIICNISGCVA
ncbi:MAG: PD-(D/E)XK nuclease domain-containing protein [Desulfovibrionaceae bacterium]|nr:PD-(D/E)XK nuclease domain-containing protein [Desulfovibrionaceae bacterium]